jgi:sugar/nucleoside kinase (ribokinase family)
MLDLISIGDSVVDTFVPLKDAEVHEREGERLLMLRFGDKIPVDPSVSMVGGNAANNAVGASRLSLKTALYTHVGNDLQAQKIVDTLKEEKVHLTYIVRDKELSSNQHVVLDFKGERTILTCHQPWKYNLPDVDQAKWVYLTSLHKDYLDSNLIPQLTNYLERTRAKLYFNPGTFQIKIGIKKIPKILAIAEVLIMNFQEAKLVLGHEEADKVPIKKLLKGLGDLGPRKIVVTDGGEGSYGYDAMPAGRQGEKYYHIKVFPAKLVEMTGAGDAYATGLLAGLFHGEELPGAMRWGSANGAAVVEEVGPQAGLLTHNKMLERLRESKDIVAKEI